jgi:endonuclease/exonuclease/phosphatase family metal-dependent hydrolase
VSEIAARLKRAPLHDAGVIVLCEAGWRTPRAGGREVPAELAAELGMNFAYAPSFAFTRGVAPMTAFMGNAILSREPLRDVRMAPMTASHHVQKLKRRITRLSGLVASIAVGGMTLTVAAAHLDRNASPQFRAGQMGEFLSAMPAQGPAVIAGDFNTTTVDWDASPALLNAAVRMLVNPRRFRNPVPHEPLFELLRQARFEIEGANLPRRPTFTFSRFIPPILRPKLDWIAVRGVRPVPGSAAVIAPRASALRRRASDHDLIVCEITV